MIQVELGTHNKNSTIVTDLHLICCIATLFELRELPRDRIQIDLSSRSSFQLPYFAATFQASASEGTMAALDSTCYAVSI